ncbi:MAG: hypothetical protein V2A58_09385 [Planctomycetota bacterium]
MRTTLASGAVLLILPLMGSVSPGQEGLIGDYRFERDAPFANAVEGGLPDIASGGPVEEPPVLVGQEIPVGGNADGCALAWTRLIPQPGDQRWIPADYRIPRHALLDLGSRFTLWLRILYGGKCRNDAGYELLALKGSGGKTCLHWFTTSDETDLAVTMTLEDKGGAAQEHSCKSGAGELCLRNSRWYDLAVTFDGDATTFHATELGRQGPGLTQCSRVKLGAGLRLTAPAGPLSILKTTNTAIESLRIYTRALSSEEVRALSEGVRVPGPGPSREATVGKERQLFLDDALIEKLEGSVARRLHPFEKFPGNPVVRKTQSNEVEGLGARLLGDRALRPRGRHLPHVAPRAHLQGAGDPESPVRDLAGRHPLGEAAA